MASPELQANESLHNAIVAILPDPQLSSPLWTKIPAEVRIKIFRHALTQYSDSNAAAQYDKNTAFSRPGYLAPRRIDTALLRTCRAVYRDCWLIPHMSMEETHWISDDADSPPEYNRRRARDILQRRLEVVATNLGDDLEDMEIASLHVFVQLKEAEMRGHRLRNLVSMPLFKYRSLTITIRHTDWDFWQDDASLEFRTCYWIEALQSTLPETVTEVRVELETLERKKHQVHVLADQITRKWHFQRRDGVSLFANIASIKEDESRDEDDANQDTDTDKSSTSKTYNELVHRWSGSSTINGITAHHDETAPGKLDYYVLTIPFRLSRDVEERGGMIESEVVYAARTNDSRVFQGGLYQAELPAAHADTANWVESFFAVQASAQTMNQFSGQALAHLLSQMQDGVTPHDLFEDD